MKKFMQHWLWLLRKFKRSEAGVSLPLIAFSFMGVMGSMGIAVDSARMQLVQNKLSSSLDAAGLAASSTVNTANINTEVTKYMGVNFPAGYLGSKLTSTTVTPNADSSVIQLSASADVPTTFMGIFGFSKSTVSASAEITRASKGLELVMVLDNTGSMAGSKLTSLKSSATSLVNILYGSNTTVKNLWIGLVPFSQAVNIGASHSAWVDSAYTGWDWGPSPSTWAGCVDAREASSRDVTDDPPSVAKFPVYYWPDDSNNNWKSTTTSHHVTTTTYSSPLNTSRGPNKNCPQVVTPMTASKTTILNGITSMQAVGNTHVNLGAAWGWRMLSPLWRNLWGGEMDTNKLPLDYNTKNMNKAVVIMTDGDNTMDNTSRTAYWYLNDNHLGSTVQATAETSLDTRLSTVCASMKNKNIIIYTILFGSASTATQNMLKNCATQANYYFASPTSTALQAAFSAIGDSLSNLRLSK